MKETKTYYYNHLADFEVLGVVSLLPDYSFCYLLNKTLRIDFAKDKIVQLFDKRSGTRFEVPGFGYNYQEHCLEVNFLKINYKIKNLNPLFQKVDYLLLSKGTIANDWIAHCQTLLHQQQQIITTYRIDKEGVVKNLVDIINLPEKKEEECLIESLTEQK